MTAAKRSQPNELILGLVSISDRASRGIYEDKGIPALKDWCEKAITTPVSVRSRLIPDDRYTIEETLRELVDREGCDLVFTTGGTGPARRDVTPEATLAVATREMPGFAEQMRRLSLHFVPTAILSRQVAVLREVPDHAALIVNLPGQPKAIAETLSGLNTGKDVPELAGIFAAIPYCIDLIGGPYIETNPDVITCFRPKSARKNVAAPAPTVEVKPAAVPAPEPAANEAAQPLSAASAPSEPPATMQPEVKAPLEKPAAPQKLVPLAPVKSQPAAAAAPLQEDDFSAIPIPTLSLPGDEEPLEEEPPQEEEAAPVTPKPEEPAPAVTKPQPVEIPPAEPARPVTTGIPGFTVNDLKPTHWDPPSSASSQPEDDRPHMTPQAIARRSVRSTVASISQLEPLPVLVREPPQGVEPACALIMLHGMGVSATDFETFNEELAAYGGPAVKLYLPQAPRIPITANNHFVAPAWFDILSSDFNSHEDVEGIRNMVMRISQIIGRVMNEGFAPNRIFLGGFSQGAAMALAAGLRQPVTLGGILALSGYLPLEKRLPIEINAKARQTPVFIGHGAFDSVIELPIAQRAVQAVEKLVDTLIWREYNMDHEICPQEGTDIAKFINTALESA